MLESDASVKSLAVSKPLLVFLLSSSFVLFAVADDSNPPDSQADEAQRSSSSFDEDLIVEGIREEIFHAFEFDDFHQVNQTGEHYYITRQYKKAFPYLLASAKRGFKLAQARLAFLYFKGLGGVESSFPLGIGWLGVAASPKTDPEIKNYFKRIMRKLPEEVKEEAQKVVDAFISKYGTKATGMSCIHTRVAGSHISKLTCNFKKEFQLRDGLYQDWLSTAFDEVSGPFGTGMDRTLVGLQSPDAGSPGAAGTSDSGRVIGIGNSGIGSTGSGSNNSN